MPIVARNPRRKGAAPLVFFRGTRRGLAGIRLDSIVKVLERAGIRFPDKAAALEVADILKDGAQGTVLQIAMEKPKGKQSKILLLRTPQGLINLKLTVFPSGKILLHQYPVAHGITVHLEGEHPFENLRKICAKGFWGGTGPNIVRDAPRGVGVGIVISEFSAEAPQASPKVFKPVLAMTLGPLPEEQLFPQHLIEMTKGDKYAIELMPFLQKTMWDGLAVRKAKPKQILRVNIQVARGLPEETIEKRKQFYLREIWKRFRIPIRFI